uniref:Uncharacterized protein n=1 Tax=Bracon brevicornis TaxID=1563983 RepID=A0A6V7LIE4_9HYME
MTLSWIVGKLSGLSGLIKDRFTPTIRAETEKKTEEEASLPSSDKFDSNTTDKRARKCRCPVRSKKIDDNCYDGEDEIGSRTVKYYSMVILMDHLADLKEIYREQ